MQILEETLSILFDILISCAGVVQAVEKPHNEDHECILFLSPAKLRLINNGHMLSSVQVYSGVNIVCIHVKIK